MNQPTIVALATPPGLGAIAVLRLSGTEAFRIADRIFKGKKLAEQPSHTAHFGRIVDEKGQIVDEAVATVFKGPKSYTGEDTVEFSLHGSPYIQQQVMALLLEYGAELAKAGEYTMRAFLNGKMDLSQAEAVADLIASENAAAHQVAMHQMRGGFKQEIDKLREELIHFASLVELELDFSEEDVEFADREKLQKLVQQIRTYIAALLQSFSLGNAIKNGVNTVIAGRPNAGKSTLLNALLNEDRAIVSDIAGTTRDSIEASLNIGGVQFRLTDTAGIREAQDAIEAIGIERALAKVNQAALLLYVWDITSGMTLANVHEDLGKLTDGKNANNLLVLCNKMDRNPYFKIDWLLDGDRQTADEMTAESDRWDGGRGIYGGDFENKIGLIREQIVPLSAKNGQNIAFLKEKMLEMATGGSMNLESTVITNTRHFEALTKADRALADVLHGLASDITGDFIAQDIRHSLAYLGEITGAIGVDDLLGNIFSKFCIGK